jgi:hypothetical protein
MEVAVQHYNDTSGKLFSKHMSGVAIDISKGSVESETAFYKALDEVKGKGVTKYIKYGQLGEKAIHVEFNFKVT